jgi:hypothetical protein
MGTDGVRNQEHCAGEGQQQFTELDWTYRRMKRQGREADYSLLSSAEIRNDGDIFYYYYYLLKLQMGC